MSQRQRESELKGRIAARRTREDMRYVRYVVIVGSGIGVLVLSCCGIVFVPPIITCVMAWSRGGSTAEDTHGKMESVTADPDRFPSVEAVNQHLGSSGLQMSRKDLAIIEVMGTDEAGFTGRLTIDYYFRSVPPDAVIYTWSRPDRQLYVAFGKNPNFPGQRMLKAVYVDHSGGEAKIKTRG